MQFSPKNMIGQQFDDRYELLELLGTGAFGSVFKARQIDADRLVAIKIFETSDESDEVFKERVIREALSLGKLKHLNIVNIYNAGISSSAIPYLVMEYISGESVRQLILEKQLNYVRSLKIARDLALAMDFAHKEGVVHRDLKPENFILVDEPEKDTVKILDFGLAKLKEERDIKLTKTGFLVGTVNYMSPEQCTGQRVDQRADIYSLGICLFEMIAGVPPFSADTPVGLIYKHVNEQLPELKIAMGKTQNRFLNELLRKATEKQPEKRFSSMAEFAQAVDELVEQIGDDTAAIEVAQKVKKQAKNTTYISLTVFLCFLVIGGFGWYRFQRAQTARTVAEERIAATNNKQTKLSTNKDLSKNLQVRMQTSLDSCERLLARGDKKGAGDELAVAIKSLLTSLNNLHPGQPELEKILYGHSERIAELASLVKLKESYDLEIALITMAYAQRSRKFSNQITADLYLIAARLARTAGESMESVRFYSDASNCRLVTNEVDLAAKALEEAGKLKGDDKVLTQEMRNIIDMGWAQVYSRSDRAKALKLAQNTAKSWLSMKNMNLHRRAQEIRSLESVLKALGDNVTAELLDERAELEAKNHSTVGVDNLVSEEAMMERFDLSKKRRSKSGN